MNGHADKTSSVGYMTGEHMNSAFLLQCLSHSPLMDLVDPAPEIRLAAEAAVRRLNREMQTFAPQLLIIFGPDHFGGFFYDLMPPFCIGVSASSIGDYSIPPLTLNVPKKLSEQLAVSIQNGGIDIAISHRMRVDHGFTQSLIALTGSQVRYPTIPIFVNSAAPPLPSMRRVRELGAAVGRFAATLNCRVAFVASGGLSHNPPVPLLDGAPPEVAERLISGRNPTQTDRRIREQKVVDAAMAFCAGSLAARPLNPSWDDKFLDMLERKAFEELDALSNAEITDDGGASAHEVKTWVAAAAAMNAATGGSYLPKRDYYEAIPEWIAGFGTLHAETPPPNRA